MNPNRLKELIKFREEKAGNMYDDAYRHSLANKDYGERLMIEYTVYKNETERMKGEVDD